MKRTNAVQKVKHIFTRLIGGEDMLTLLETLADIIKKTESGVAKDKSKTFRSAIQEGLKNLIQVCLGFDHESRKSREQFIRIARGILLRVEHHSIMAPYSFPVWVQDQLLDNILQAIHDDIFAFTDGKPVRAKDLALMLAANYAVIQTQKYKAYFFDFLKQLVYRSEDYDDPFLRDRVFIIQRSTRPEDIDEFIEDRRSL